MKHAGKLFAALIILIMLFSIFGCKPAQEVSQSDTVEKIVIESIPHTDTTYLSDSASLLALLYCDSVGQARIKQIEQFTAGQYVKSKVIIKDNYLSVNSVIDSAAIVNRWTEIRKTTSKEIYRIVVNTVKFIPGWAYACLYFTVFVLAIGLVVVAFFSIKNQWYTILINLGISLVNKLKKKK